MKYIIASQHYKQWNNNHYECIAKFIKRNPGQQNPQLK